jgi:hypothetical protein
MSSRKQRESNRNTAYRLSKLVRQKFLATQICPHCGEHGGHYILTKPSSLYAMLTGVDDQEGFYTCDSNYRIPTHF